MNSRLAIRLAPAFTGSCAFVRAETLLAVGSPKAAGHRDGEDPSHPGDSGV